MNGDDTLAYGDMVYIESGVGGYPPSNWMVCGWSPTTVDLFRVVSGRIRYDQMQRVDRDIVTRALRRYSE